MQLGENFFEIFNGEKIFVKEQKFVLLALRTESALEIT